ncbi:MAG TPA: FGGY-family carbohydrate kinase [Acidimicrobiales bacterium]
MSPPTGEACTIGVDVGTTSVKAVAVDGRGTVVARTRVAHKVVTPSAELLEHDVARAWQRDPRRAFAEVSSGLDGPAAGVTVTSMVPSITAVDGRARALLPGLLYGDARAADVVGAVGEAGIADPAGMDRRQSAERYQGRRMLDWAVGQRPGARGYWNCQATATHALTGVPAVDQATATSFGGLYDGGGWDKEALHGLGLDEAQLPVVGGMGQALGTVPGSPTVFAGGSIDAFCEQIVAGASRPGDVLVIFGATLIVWVVAEEWREVPGLTTLPTMTAGQVMIGGPSNAGALFADWARSMTGGSSRRASSTAPGEAPEPLRPGDPTRVPVWLPYLRGERTPFHDATLRSSVHGLDIAQGPDALLRAAHEASGFVVRRIIDRSGFEATRVLATGGGSRSLPWMQAVADATGLPVDTVAVSEGAALGAAFLARMAAGLETSFDAAQAWARVGRRIEPDPAWATAADHRYRRFQSLGPPG